MINLNGCNLFSSTIEQNRIICLMSTETWEVFAQYSEPEAHDHDSWILNT